MKRKFMPLAVLVIGVAFAVTSLSAEFWASQNSNKYHYPTCKWAQKINPKNLIKFNSPEEAKSAGYVPCKVCKPPVAKAQSDNITLASLNKSKERHRSGYCSWHGDVCGYSGDSVLCCDGTLSPSCMCGD